MWVAPFYGTMVLLCCVCSLSAARHSITRRRTAANSKGRETATISGLQYPWLAQSILYAIILARIHPRQAVARSISYFGDSSIQLIFAMEWASHDVQLALDSLTKGYSWSISRWLSFLSTCRHNLIVHPSFVTLRSIWDAFRWNHSLTLFYCSWSLKSQPQPKAASLMTSWHGFRSRRSSRF